MSHTLQAAQTRPRPDGEDESLLLTPAEKKPRLEISESTATIDVDVDFSEPPKVSGNDKAPKKVSRKQKRKKQKHALPEPYSGEDVLWRDVISVLGQDYVDEAIKNESEWDSPFEFREEVDLEVSSLGSSGEFCAF